MAPIHNDFLLGWNHVKYFCDITTSSILQLNQNNGSNCSNFPERIHFIQIPSNQKCFKQCNNKQTIVLYARWKWKENGTAEIIHEIYPYSNKTMMHNVILHTPIFILSVEIEIEFFKCTHNEGSVLASNNIGV